MKMGKQMPLRQSITMSSGYITSNRVLPCMIVTVKISYMCICHLVYGCDKVCTCLSIYREAKLTCHIYLSHFSLRQGFSLNLELINLVRLISQCDLRIYPFPSSVCSQCCVLGVQTMPPYIAFMWVLKIQTQVLILTCLALYQLCRPTSHHF